MKAERSGNAVSAMLQLRVLHELGKRSSGLAIRILYDYEAQLLWHRRQDFTAFLVKIYGIGDGGVGRPGGLTLV